MSIRMLFYQRFKYKLARPEIEWNPLGKFQEFHSSRICLQNKFNQIFIEYNFCLFSFIFFHYFVFAPFPSCFAYIDRLTTNIFPLAMAITHSSWLGVASLRSLFVGETMCVCATVIICQKKKWQTRLDYMFLFLFYASNIQSSKQIYEGNGKLLSYHKYEYMH